MNWVQLVAELGGMGAILPLIGGGFSAIFGSLREAQDLNRQWALKSTGAEDAANKEKLAQLDQSKLGKKVVWFIVFTALAVLSAGVWFPLVAFFCDWILTMVQLFKFDTPVIAPTIAVEWYWPTQGSFLFWDWDKLHPIHVGSEDAKYTIAILPTFISIAANTVSFFLMNRVRKKNF